MEISIGQFEKFVNIQNPQKEREKIGRFHKVGIGMLASKV